MTAQQGGAPRIPPLDNWAFQKIFGERESERASRTLANLVLGHLGIEPIGAIDSITADASLPNTVSLKAPRQDVVLVSGERVVDLEAQRFEVDVENKAVYYASCLLASRIEKDAGYDYEDLPQTVVVMFMQGNVKFPGEGRFVTAGRLHWELDGGCRNGNDRFVFALVELDKVGKMYNASSEEVASDELTAWLYVLAKGWRNPEEVERIMGKILSVKEFGERYNLAMGDPEAWDAYDRHVKWEMEMNSIEKRIERRIEERVEKRVEKRLTREATAAGFDKGYDKGYGKGQAEGYSKGYDSGQAEGFDKGYDKGQVEGFDKGQAEGFDKGRVDLADKLRALGVDESLLAQALDGPETQTS